MIFGIITATIVIHLINNGLEAQSSATSLSNQDDVILKEIHHFGNIYDYNKAFDIDLITNASIDYTKVDSTNFFLSEYETWSSAFHFGGMIGYTVEETVDLCRLRCQSMVNEGCVGGNYVEHVKWCILIRTYAPLENTWRPTKWTVEYFYFKNIAKPTRDYNNSIPGVLPEKLGQSYFRPYGFENRNARIINGHEAKPFSWPWMAEIITSDLRTCSSFLIAQNPESDIVGDSSDKVITAAHCVIMLQITPETYENHYGRWKQTVVILGNHRRDLFEAHEIRLHAKSVIIHETYEFWTGYNDIALIQLEKPVKFSEYIRPVALPNDDGKAAVDMSCMAAGWGKVSLKGEHGKFLKQEPVKIIDCKNRFEWCKNKIAAMSLEDAGMAGGDSGGPLLCYNRTSDQFIAYGTASSVLHLYYPGVNQTAYYVDIPKLKEWIIKAAKLMDNADVDIPLLTSFSRPWDQRFDTTYIATLKELLKIYKYPENHELNYIYHKMVIIEQRWMNNDFKARIGFHFDDFIGYTKEKTVYACIARCDAHNDCHACNYVSNEGLCFLLKTATIDKNRTLWIDEKHPSVHIYFTGPTKGATQPDFDSMLKSGIVPWPHVGKAYFMPLEVHYIEHQGIKYTHGFVTVGFRNNDFEFIRCTVELTGIPSLIVDDTCEARQSIGDIVFIPNDGKYTVYKIGDIITNNTDREIKNIPNSTASTYNLLYLRALHKSDLEQAKYLPIFEQAFKQIVANIEVKPHSLPWMVEVTSQSIDALNRQCNGILLNGGVDNKVTSSITVLTTRSCLLKTLGGSIDPKDITIKLASHRIDLTESHEQKRKTKRVVYYQPLEQETMALIILDEPVPFTNYVSPIQVKEDDATHASKCSECFVAGWRSYEEDCEYDGPYLGITHIKANLTDTVCQCNHTSEYKNVTVRPPKVSIFDEKMRKKPCKINPGAPLICFDSTAERYFVKKFVAEYVTSKFDFPAITYTSMSGVGAWIEQEMKFYNDV